MEMKAACPGSAGRLFYGGGQQLPSSSAFSNGSGECRRRRGAYPADCHRLHRVLLLPLLLRRALFCSPLLLRPPVRLLQLCPQLLRQLLPLRRLRL